MVPAWPLYTEVPLYMSCIDGMWVSGWVDGIDSKYLCNREFSVVVTWSMSTHLQQKQWNYMPTIALLNIDLYCVHYLWFRMPLSEDVVSCVFGNVCKIYPKVVVRCPYMHVHVIRALSTVPNTKTGACKSAMSCALYRCTCTCTCTLEWSSSPPHYSCSTWQ